MSKIEDALKSAGDTKALIMGFDVLGRAGELFEGQFPGKKAVIVADETTYAVAGKTVEKVLGGRGTGLMPPYIFKAENLYAEYGYADALAASLRKHDAIPVAVGAGTVNDLAKLASHLAGKPYMCVATAASMDGYTAFGASVTANGAKQTFDCPAPRACLADVEVICKAPRAMTASGYADLFAKVTAGADWLLADLLGVERVDEESFSIVQDGLHDSLADPEGVRDGCPEAIAALTGGLLLGGFAMQRFRSSRPASGAEHQFSHLWNMEHHLNGGKLVSHGFQVAIGTLAVLALYGEFLKSPMEKLDVESCCREWPLPGALAEESAGMFRNTDFPDIGRVETAAKYVTREELAVQLQTLKDNWPAIREKIRGQLVPFEEARRRVKLAGAPVEPEEIGITRQYLRASYVRAQYIRRRFTVLDLAVRMNHLDKWLDALFGKGGAWETR